VRRVFGYLVRFARTTSGGQSPGRARFASNATVPAGPTSAVGLSRGGNSWTDATLTVASVRWHVRRPSKPPDTAELRTRALIALAELAAERDGDFVAAHRVSSRLGKAPGLGRALEELLERGLY
jgi:hypothetical protein